MSFINLFDSVADLAVIMSVYKNDKLDYLKESVFSILNQTYRNFFYYIAFDGPVSKECENFLKNLKDSRIRIFRLEKNEGLAVALNFLLRNVLKEPDIEYIARMDADDISDPDRLRKQREYLFANSDISCLGSWYHVIDESGKLISSRRMPVNHEDIRSSFCFRTPVAHPSVMLRRNLIEIAGFYPSDSLLMEDTVLWGRALKHGLLFANLPELLIKFRRDMEFYRRRSGIRYGWHYIKNRFIVNKELNLSFSCYLITFCAGIIKMMPSRIVRCFYLLEEQITLTR